MVRQTTLFDIVEDLDRRRRRDAFAGLVLLLVITGIGFAAGYAIGHSTGDCDMPVTVSEE